MKIVHVETGMNLYGGALQVSYLLRGMSERSGIVNCLVCPRGSAVADACAGSVERVYEVPMRGDLDFTFIRRLAGIIRKEEPDILHLHSRRGADVMGGIAARRTGTRCLLTRRVDNPENRILARLKYPLFDHIITISEGIREVLLKEGVPGEKITCVHSAVDVDPYGKACDRDWFRAQFGLPEGSLACGVVAQFIERKGHSYLIKAIPEIVGAVPQASFLFFGKGPLQEQMVSLGRELGMSDRIRYAGFRDDLDRILGCLDLVIHPALMEGLGVSLLQAAAAGVPIVATRVGGIPEVVEQGVNGLLIPPANSGDIAASVIEVLRNRDLAARMGLEGRRLARERFSVDAMVKGNLQVYSSLLKERQ